MKKHFAVLVLILLMLGLCVPPVFAAGFKTVKGVCKDTDGKPLAGAVVVYANQDTGQKYVMPPANKKGEYFSLGVATGNYNVTLYKNADDEKANKELFHFNKFPVKAEENTLDFDLKKMADEQAKSSAAGTSQDAGVERENKEGKHHH